MSFINQMTASSLIWLLVTLVTLSTAITSPDAQEQSEQSDTSSYGERLAEGSSYSFNSVSNSGISSNSHVRSFGQSKEGDASFYSPGVSAILNSDGFLNTMSKFSPGGVDSGKYTPSGPVEAAVHTKKTVEVIPVRFEEPKEGEPQVIEISPYEVPLSIVFKTQTNKINVNQEHRSETPEEVKETTSEEEPHRVVHNVFRPIIQEVTEVIQPYRKMLQRVEPVIEEMKTIISKAGPPEEGGNNQQQSSYGRSSSSSAFNGFSVNNQKATVEDNRFARFGGNDLGKGLSIVPLSYSSASEVIKKFSSSPQSSTSMSNENEISRRFGFTNRQNRQDENPNFSQTTNNNNEEVPANKADYNEIIKEYISKFLEPKPGQSKPNNKHSMKINPQSIKMFNVPLKSMPSNTVNSVKMYKENNQQQQNGEKPKFKIIKEFRVTLDDLKKLKLAPFILQAKANAQANSKFPKNAFNSRSSPSSSQKSWNQNFSVPFSASSFKPITANGMAVQESKPMPVNTARQHDQSPKRMEMEHVPMSVHFNSHARASNNGPSRMNNNNSFSRRQLHVQENNGSSQKKRQSRQQQNSSLKGISPPNFVFAAAASPSSRSVHDHHLDHAFRRSAEEQAFFESKRLRA